MSDEQSNSDLIRQLRIDENQRVPVKNTSTSGARARSSAWVIIVCSLLSCLVGFLVSYGWFVGYTSNEADTNLAISNVLEQQDLSPPVEMIGSFTGKAAKSSDNQNEEGDKVAAKNKPASKGLESISQNKILDASGYVTARRIATVSAKVVGLITSINVEEGMQVEKGQVLALIDDSSAQVGLALAKTQVEMHRGRIESLKVEHAEALRVLARQMELKKAGKFSSESQLSQAQSLVDRLNATIMSAVADLKAARLSVEARQIDVDNHVITAPYSGVVTAKNAQAGEIMSPSAAGGGFTRTGICTIVDMDSLEIEVDVNEAYIGRVVQGQPVVAVLDAYPKLKIPASVIAVIPTADRAKATVRVRIKIQQYDPRILPDMSVKVSFYSGEQ